MISDALKGQIAAVNSSASYRLMDGYCLDAELDAKFIQKVGSLLDYVLERTSQREALREMAISIEAASKVCQCMLDYVAFIDKNEGEV